MTCRTLRGCRASQARTCAPWWTSTCAGREGPPPHRCAYRSGAQGCAARRPVRSARPHLHFGIGGRVRCSPGGSRVGRPARAGCRRVRQRATPHQGLYVRDRPDRERSSRPASQWMWWRSSQSRAVRRATLTVAAMPRRGIPAAAIRTMRGSAHQAGGRGGAARRSFALSAFRLGQYRLGGRAAAPSVALSGVGCPSPPPTPASPAYSTAGGEAMRRTPRRPIRTLG